MVFQELYMRRYIYLSSLHFSQCPNSTETINSNSAKGVEHQPPGWMVLFSVENSNYPVARK